MNIDWQSSDSDILTSPHKPPATSLADLPDLKAHLWLETSGSTSAPKMVALAKSAILLNAQALNKKFELQKNDIWASVLPSYHIGGLSIFARAHLSQSQVKTYTNKWQPQDFVQWLDDEEITVTSLVPRQIYDLSLLQLRAPPSLRIVFVGGGHLPESVLLEALKNKWPLVLTYGFTECSSQVANTAVIRQVEDDRRFQLAEHIEAQTDEQSYLKVKSQALLTGYAEYKNQKWQFFDPKKESWFLTRDRVSLSDRFLQFLGRESDQLKINGKLVNLQKLQWQISESFPGEDIQLLGVHNLRSGQAIAALVEGPFRSELQKKMVDYNLHLPSEEKLSQIYFVEKIQRTELNKFNLAENLKTLGTSSVNLS